MLRILIADDHAIVRKGLKQILLEEYPSAIIEEVNDAEGVIKKTTRNEWDIIICDLSMPGRSGLEILKEVKQTYPGIRVLMLSMHPEDRFAVRAIKSGAAGYVTKESAAEELVKAIRQVHSGGKFITPSLTEKIVNSFEPESNRPFHERLSDRELQILNLIVAGKQIKDIAHELSLSPATVATYRARVLEKMNMKSNVELTSYALRHHLID